MGRKYTRWIPVLICAALAVAVYYPVFFQGFWAVNSSDAVHLHLPNSYVAAEIIRGGHFPLWNPHFNLGQPTIDGSTSPFHPAMFFYLLSAPWVAHTIEILLGFLLTCLGAWCFLRQQGFRRFSSAIGTTLYALSGPVFFLHSYHLAFMAILALPWCLWLFHRYDRTTGTGWLWGAAFLTVLAVQSLDSDILFYLYAAFAIDRLICLPARRKSRYILTWAAVLSLTALTGLLLYLPLYEWLSHSSRAARSYAGVLPPDFLNMFSAIITNRWSTSWPYDVFYFYIGPAVIWLALAGLIGLKERPYISRYFRYAAAIPVSYALLCAVQIYFPQALSSFDVWRAMFIFCLALAALAAAGTDNILRGRFLRQWLSAVFVFISAAIGVWAIYRGMEPRIYLAFLVTSVSVLMTVFPWSRKNRLFYAAGICLAVMATTVASSVYHASGSRTCVRYDTEITENLPFYGSLGKTRNGTKGHWRVSVFGGTYNLTTLAGLRTVPNYVSIYNKGLEEALYSDGLITGTSIHPYWMSLKSADARALAVYGVRYLVMNTAPLCVRPPTDNVHPQWKRDGWLEQKRLVWPRHRVWENAYYVGRAYMVMSSGMRASGVEFLEDKPTSVVLRAKAQNRGDRLVLADLDYPGWEVFVDEKPVSGETYHGCLRSVRLSKGEHVVQWKYNGRMQRIGLAMSAAAMLFLIGLLSVLSKLSYIKNAQRRKGL